MYSSPLATRTETCDCAIPSIQLIQKPAGWASAPIAYDLLHWMGSFWQQQLQFKQSTALSVHSVSSHSAEWNTKKVFDYLTYATTFPFSAA